ncbi:hypothetical protein CEXT_29241 [Caerostris extrusa]|uniref:Uncharacterized protein n=1 Tax=Caerostris extrusa TaxID=172846 RepID=A0AAV4QDL8_CAEEX|nr:hypothetical protein CEXT_29241 [Caerostris extrusa]
MEQMPFRPQREVVVIAQPRCPLFGSRKGREVCARIRASILETLGYAVLLNSASVYRRVLKTFYCSLKDCGIFYA